VLEARGFDWHTLADLTAKLRLGQKSGNARSRFVFAVSYLGGRLRRRISDTVHAAPRNEDDIERLFFSQPEKRARRKRKVR
jgi:hypothetical protein